MSKYLVVNFDRKEYLRPENFGESEDLASVLNSYDGILTALMVLLSDGNGRGGGDLHSEHPVIGTWAGSRVAIIDEVVTDPLLSEPGMENIPLQTQLLSVGKDVSSVLVGVIGEAEKNYSMLYFLNPLLNLPLCYQRKLGESGLRLIHTAEARKTPLESLTAFMSILGVCSAWSVYSAKKQLQKGLFQTAEAFESKLRYDVLDLTWTKGNRVVKSPYGQRSTMVSAVTEMTVTMQERSLSAPTSVTLKFGPNGHSPETVFKEIFPDVVFEKTPSLAASVASPEVAKLLSMISKREA